MALPLGAWQRGSLMNGSAWRGAQFLFARHVLRKARLVARADYFDLRVHCFSGDVIGRHLYKRGAIERRMTETLIERLVLPAGSVSFDVGANLGWYSLILDRLAQPGARVFAFEPDPENFGLLLANVEANAARTVHPQQLAVSDRAGTQTLHRYSSKNRGRHSLLPGAGDDRIEVEVTALDTFRAAEAPQAPVAFVKVDVEGYELPVLRGARATLADTSMALVEISPERMQAAGHPPEEALRLLLEAGLEPKVLGAGGLEPVAVEALTQGRGSHNVLWLRDR
jgi:FkbM family methyltransferase